MVYTPNYTCVSLGQFSVSEMSHLKTFAELLTAFMERTGIGDAELARRIPVSRPTLIRWKEGVTARPRYREDVVRCAEILRLTAEETDELLLAAGFSSGTAPPLEELPPSSEAAPTVGAASHTAPRRRRLRVFGAAVLLLIAAAVAALAFGLLDTTVYPVAAEGESLIVTAPFVNYTAGAQGFNVVGRLRAAIDAEIRAVGLTAARTVEWPEEIDGAAAAEEASRRSKATLVIWGEYDSGRVIARFTGPGGGFAGAQQVVDIVSSPAELPTTINVGLTGEVRHVALLTLGRLYLEQREFDRAKHVFLRALDLSPSDATALANVRFLLGHAYMGGDLADLDEAIWLFTQVLAVEPQSVDVLNSRAGAFLDRGRAGDADLAIDDLLHAASIRPGRAATSLNLAVAYLDRGTEGDPDRALAALTEALAAQPDYAGAFVNRAGAYVARGAPGDLDLAFDDLDEALEIEPDLASAYLSRGIVYLARGSAGDLERAIEELGRAIALDPDSAAHFNRGLIHSELGDWNASLADLRRAQELSPRQPAYNGALCLQLSVTGDPAAALPYCERAAAVEPEGLASDGRGLANALLGRTEEAIADFEAFLAWVDVSPDDGCGPRYSPTRESWEGGFTFEVQHSGLEDLGRRPVAEALTRRIVVRQRHFRKPLLRHLR